MSAPWWLSIAVAAGVLVLLVWAALVAGSRDDDAAGRD